MITENEQKLSAELKEAQARMAKLEDALLRTAGDSAAAAIRAAGGEPALLGIAVTKRLKVYEDGERLIVGVADGDGRKRIRNSRGDAFTIDDLVGEMNSDPSLQAAFGPATSNNAPANSMRRAAFDQLTAADKMAHIKGGRRVVD